MSLARLRSLVPGVSRFTFTPIDLRECLRIGTERFENNRASNVVDQRFAHKTSIDVSVQGVLGEYALTKLAGGSMALLNDTTPNSFRTDRGDIILEDDGGNEDAVPKIEIKSPVTHCADRVFPIRVPSRHIIVNRDTIYCLIVIVRPGNDVIAVDYDSRSRRGETPPDVECTYTEDDGGLVAEFRGFVHGRHVFADSNYRNKAFWCDGPLTTWDEAVCAGES